MSVNVPSGYKQTKVGVIPEDWDVVKLGEVATFYKGKGISKKEISIDGTPCIRYGELYTKYNEKIKDIFSKTSTPKEELFLSQANDILIPASGETAIDLATASCVLYNDIGLGGDINVIRSSLNGIFLAYYLNTIAKIKIASLAQGVSVIHLYSSQLKSLYIASPSLKEQQKIAQILTTWDDAISKQETLIKSKEELKKGLMQKLLSGEVRFGEFGVGTSVPSSSVEKNGTEVPTPGEWEEIRLGDIAKITMGQSPSSSSYNEQKIGIPLIQGNADCKNRKTLPRTYTTEKTKECFIDDIIMTVRAPVGAISKSFHNACIGRGVCAIKPKNDNQYLYHFLVYYEGKWEKYSQGSTFTAVNSSDIRNLKIKIPLKEEQQKIAEGLTLADKEIELLKNELEALKEQKRGLMQRLLSGGVRVVV